jgi:hypothetical protein
MAFSTTNIRATAALYSVPELQEKIRALHLKLEDPDMITAANTGGTSYTRQQRVAVEELIALYQATIDYKQNGNRFPAAAQIITPIATH